MEERDQAFDQDAGSGNDKSAFDKDFGPNEAKQAVQERKQVVQEHRQAVREQAEEFGQAVNGKLEEGAYRLNDKLEEDADRLNDRLEEEAARMGKKHDFRLTAPIVITVLVGIVIAAAIAIYFYLSTVNVELYKERAYHLSETMTTLAEKANIILSDNWSALESAEQIIGESEISDSASVIAALDHVNTLLPNTNYSFIAIDSSRTCYRNDVEKTTQTWQDPTLLLNEDRQQIALESISSGAVSVGEYMVFLLRLNESVPLSFGPSITHVGIIVDMGTFREVFQSSAYNNKNQTILLKADGTRVYYDSEDSLFNNYNVLGAIERTEFLYDMTPERFSEECANGTQGTAEIKYEGARYFIGYTTLDFGLRYITIVPEEFVSANSLSLTSTLTRGAGILAGIIAMMDGFYGGT